MFKKLCISTFLSLLFVSSYLSAEVDYEILDIGTLQTQSSKAIALNNNGQILGWYNIDGTNEGKHFFVRDRDGTFHEISEDIVVECETISGIHIIHLDWRYLTDDGKAYGTLTFPDSNPVLFMWDNQNGIVELGMLPGKEVMTINNAGQVLIKSVVEYQKGRSIQHPAIWDNGQITKLNGLEGNTGILSEESYGYDMNNNGEVVGKSVVHLVNKNEIYKQTHATKWVNGKAIDLHKKVPKTNDTHAVAINDSGEILMSFSEKYGAKYLLRNDGGITVLSYDLNMLNSAGYVYNYNYDYGMPVRGVGFIVKDRNGKDLCHDSSINIKLQKDSNSIWIKTTKLISVNDNGEIIALGVTIYGEEHAMLLIPVKPE